MCLGIPGRVVEVFQRDELPMGKVDFGGVRKEVCLAYTPEVQPGEYVLVHVGFALSRIEESEAQETLRMLREIAQAEADAASEEPPAPDAAAKESEAADGAPGAAAGGLRPLDRGP